jgi:hypothetical protein
MQSQDKKAFKEAIEAAFEIHDKKVTVSILRMYWNALKGYELSDVLLAIDGHNSDPERGSYKPKPADLIRHLPRGKQHPGADEAWTIAIQAADEGASLIWTQQIAEAWGIVSSLYLGGDKSGARMAFRDAYNRIIQSAGEPVAVVSIGHDLAGREDIVPKAISDGLLPQSAAETYLITHEGKHSCAKLLSGPKPSNESLAKRWSEIQEALKRGAAKQEAGDMKDREAKKKAEESRRELLIKQSESLNK